MSDAQYDNKTYNQLYNEVHRKLNVLLRQVRAYVEAEVKHMYKDIKIEISGYFKTIVNTTFISVFTKNYGGYFNPKDLLNSIECGVDDNLSPYLYYQDNGINFGPSFLSNVREFNANSDGVGFKKILDSDEFNTLEADGAFLNGEDPLTVILDESKKKKIQDNVIFSTHNKALQQGAYASIQNTYAEAKSKAIEEFYNEYYTKIVPLINKKYGIDIK